MILLICITLSLLYCLLIVSYIIGWRRQKDFVLPDAYHPKTNVSVIIPARNEAQNIAACIEAILNQEYPNDLLEIIVVDDHSTDTTADIVKGYAGDNVKCISLATYINPDEKINAYKKKALTAGISISKGDLIITTDADCVAPRKWIKNIAAMHEQQKAVMIVAPVKFIADNSVVQIFQSLDFMSMQGITAAAYQLKMGNMSNGANLAFSKAAFNDVEGYAGVDHIASGDDFLLMMKLNKRYPEGIAYLKTEQAIVSTSPQPDWYSFIQQRIRWASKTGKYDDKKLTAVLAFVYLYNLLFLGLAIGGFFHHLYWSVATAMLIGKIIIELIFLFPVAGFFNNRRQLWYFPFLQVIHIIYIILAGFLGFIGVYHWKGRKTV